MFRIRLHDPYHDVIDLGRLELNKRGQSEIFFFKKPIPEYFFTGIKRCKVEYFCIFVVFYREKSLIFSDPDQFL